MNIIMKRIRHIKTSLSYFNYDKSSLIYVTKIKVHHGYLNDKEVDLIYNLKLNNNQSSLKKTRKLFLVQLYNC